MHNNSIVHCLNGNQKLFNKELSSFRNEVTIKFEPGYVVERPEEIKLIESNNNNNNNNIDGNGNVKNKCCPTNEIKCNTLNKADNNISAINNNATTMPTTTTTDRDQQSTVLCYGCNRKILLTEAIQTTWTVANTDDNDNNQWQTVQFIENKIFRCTFCHVKDSVSHQNKKTYNNHMDFKSVNGIQIKSEDISIELVKNLPSALPENDVSVCENENENIYLGNDELFHNPSVATIVKEEVILADDEEEEIFEVIVVPQENEEEEEEVVVEEQEPVLEVLDLENAFVEFVPNETELQMNTVNDNLNKCNECDKLFEELSHVFKEHLRPNLNKQPYKCDVWFRRTAIFSHLKEHVQNTHCINCQNCGICRTRFKNMVHLIIKHRQASLIDEHARCFCNNWNRGLQSLINIKKHIDAMHVANRIGRCQIYHVRLGLLMHLKCHFNDVHEQGTGIQIINCTECNLIFENLANVIVDENKSIDSKGYNVIEHLRRHMHEIHNNERVTIKNYQDCEICMKREMHIIHLLRRHTQSAYSINHSSDS